MENFKLKLKAYWRPECRRLELFANYYGTLGRGVMCGKPIEFETLPEGEASHPIAAMNDEEAQCLMDSLWDCGIRPTAGQGSAEQLAATERHLEDMRTIAFSTVKGGMYSPKTK